jgi:hypothetical protein
MGVAPENVVVDFIAVLLQYAWSVEKQGDAEVGIERKTGFRMQTNVHLAAKGESAAQVAISAAFQEGVTDIIAFDDWSKDLDEVQVAARGQALKAAQSKAEVLLGATLPETLGQCPVENPGFRVVLASAPTWSARRGGLNRFMDGNVG